MYRSDINAREPKVFERDLIKGLGSDALSIEGWLMRGAIREDDVLAGFSDHPPPQDDSYNTGDVIRDNRPLHHFYDPRNDRGLRVGLTIGEKAPDWGIGADDAFADINAADAWRRNHFTVFDAREAMFRALTGMNGSGSKAIGAGGSTPSSAADKEAVRKAYWATTFRALGDLVHLIQDMAQPQHTRNDPHAGSDDYEDAAGPLGHKSFYENYIEQRATREAIPTSDGNSYTPAALVYDNGYPIPRFNDYVSYFSTRNVDTSVASRKGLADYSNRGFFSAGKNLGQGDYDSPPNSISGGFYTPEQQTVSADGTKVHVLKGSVSDAYASNTAASGVPLTAFGAWNDALQQATEQETFTLIRENYDAMADLLIPRAVAYSAGLIDHFFRGRLEITPPDEGVYAIVDHAVVNGIDEGFGKIKLKIRNATPSISDGVNTYPQSMAAGDVYAVVRFRRNPCYESDLSGEHGPTGAIINGCAMTPNPTVEDEIVVSDAVPVQSINGTDPQDMVFIFSDGVIPLNATDVYLQVVFRGRLGGEEDAVVVTTKDISEPTYYGVTNSSDYLINDTGQFEPVQNSSDSYNAQNVTISFQDTHQYIASLSNLPLYGMARLAMLVDSETISGGIFSANARAIANNKSLTSRIATLWNRNQKNDSGIQVTTPFNGCGTFRGTNYLDGWVLYSGDNTTSNGTLECNQGTYSGMTQFTNINLIPFDDVRF